MQLLCLLIAEEVSTLFRGTSLTTTLMDQYMKMVAIPYLQKTIGDVVAKIVDCKQSCEVRLASQKRGSIYLVKCCSWCLRYLC